MYLFDNTAANYVRLISLLKWRRWKGGGKVNFELTLVPSFLLSSSSDDKP